MQGLDEVGRFWLVGHTDDTLSGRLTFEPDGRIELKVVGRFDHLTNDGSADIHGWFGTKKISLFDGFRMGSIRPSPGIGHETYRSNRMFIGQHLDPSDVSFDSVMVEFSDLSQWIGIS